MRYEDIPVVEIPVNKGNTEDLEIWGIVVQGAREDIRTINPRIQFKTTIDTLRYADFELTVDNGRLEIGENYLILKFRGFTAKLPQTLYWGDLLVDIVDGTYTILRFKLDLDEVVTAAGNGCN